MPKTLLKKKPAFQMRDDMLFRCVRVNRKCRALTALTDTGAHPRGSREELVETIKTAPRNKGDDPEILFFFRPSGRSISLSAKSVSKKSLARQYRERGLRPADVHEMAAAAKDESSAVRKLRFGTYWIDSTGNVRTLRFTDNHRGFEFEVDSPEDQEIVCLSSEWLAGVRDRE